MKLRIAALALAVAFLAAPTLCVAETTACPPCCPEAGDMDGSADEGSCGDRDAASSTESCCEAAPVAPNVESTRTLDIPSPQPLATASIDLASATPQFGPAPRRAADLAFRTSPLRLSVVRLI